MTQIKMEAFCSSVRKRKLDKLKYIFASRKTLIQSGLTIRRNLKRLTPSRKRKIDEFKLLVEDNPNLFKNQGSNQWIQGLLTHLNEPGVLSWDNVVEWLATKEIGEYFHTPPMRTASSRIKKVPAIITQGQSGGDKKIKTTYEESPQLKHAAIHLIKEAETMMPSESDKAQDKQALNSNEGSQLFVKGKKASEPENRMDKPQTPFQCIFAKLELIFLKLADVELDDVDVAYVLSTCEKILQICTNTTFGIEPETENTRDKNGTRQDVDSGFEPPQLPLNTSRNENNSSEPRTANHVAPGNHQSPRPQPPANFPECVGEPPQPTNQKGPQPPQLRYRPSRGSQACSQNARPRSPSPPNSIKEFLHYAERIMNDPNVCIPCLRQLATLQTLGKLLRQIANLENTLRVLGRLSQFLFQDLSVRMGDINVVLHEFERIFQRRYENCPNCNNGNDRQ